MKKFEILLITILFLSFVSCNDKNNFANSNINPDIYKDLAIIFPGGSKAYTADYDINETLKCKAKFISKNGLVQIKIGKIFGSTPPVMEDVIIPDNNKNLFDFEYDILADETFSQKDFKGIKVFIQDTKGNTVEDVYSITGKVIKDPLNIKFRGLLMTLDLQGIYPNTTVAGNSYFASTAEKPIMNYDDAKANQGKIEFMIVGDIDENFEAGGGHGSQLYPFGLFTPNRQSVSPKTVGLYQKGYTQFNDVYMSWAGDVISAADFDDIYSGKTKLTDAMVKFLTKQPARINDKGWIWIPANGVLFYRIGGGIITQTQQTQIKSIRWGFVKFIRNWGNTLAQQTAEISVIVQRPEVSGL